MTALALAGGAILLHSFDAAQRGALATALPRFRGGVFALAVAGALLQALFQASRLHAVLPRRWGISWLRSVKTYNLGQVANVLFPARAGDAAKAVSLHRHSRERSASIVGAGGLIVADKVVDLAAALALLVVTGAVPLPAGPVRWLPLAGGMALLGGPRRRLAALASDSTPGCRGARIAARALRHLAAGLVALADPRRVARGIALGMSGWFVEALILAALASSLGYHLSAGQAVSAIVVLNLGIAVPVAVANVGAFEASLALGLGHAGVPFPEALAVAAAHHAVQLAATLGFGAALWVSGAIRRGALRSITSLLEDFQGNARDRGRVIRYYEARSRDYSGLVQRGPLRYLRHLERSAVLELARLDDDTKETVIDVGCGDGFYALTAKRAGKWVHAVDIAPGMVERVRGRVDRAEVVDLGSFDPSRTYDIVICAGALDFVPCPEAAFRQLCRLVASSGRLVVQLPSADWMGLFHRIEKGLCGIRVNLYRREWVEDRAGRCGLELKRWRRPLGSSMVLLFEPGGPLLR